MSTMLKRIMLSLSVVVATAVAQETPTKADAPSNEQPAPEKTAPKAESDQPDTVVTAARKKEKRRVLRPEEVPGELMRLKTKADIKAELKIRTTSGKPVVFSGVIRNGKLIERIIDRRFAPQKNVSHPRCGVRIWWAGDSDGYIFFRYSTIESIAITGKLTADERAEIMRRLQAKRDGVDPDAKKKAAAEAEAKAIGEVEKMSVEERGKYLMQRFPAKAGWSAKHYGELRRKKIIDNAKLAPNEELFVKYYRELEQARYRTLRESATKKEEFEPGTADESDKDGESSPEEKKEE